MQSEAQKLVQSEMEARQSRAYATQNAIYQYTKEVVKRMRSRKVSKAMLAERIGTSQAYVSKVLGGDNNFTIETMSKIAFALDANVTIQLTEKSINVDPRICLGGVSSTKYDVYIGQNDQTPFVHLTDKKEFWQIIHETSAVTA